MSLLADVLSYIDSRKRVAKSNLSDPGFGLLGMASPPEVQAERQRKQLATKRRLESGGGLLGRSVMPGVDKVTDSPEFEAAMNAPMGLLGWTAYHGSPHKFDKFQLDKIGTGEGAQAYGHGLYFADEPGVARSYQPASLNLVPTRAIPDEQLDAYSKGYAAMLNANGDAMAAKKSLENQVRIWSRKAKSPIDAEAAAWQIPRTKQAIDLIDSGAYQASSGNSHFYKVDIDDARAPKDAFVYWDRKLSEQPAAVRKKLERYADDLASMGNPYAPNDAETFGRTWQQAREAFGTSPDEALRAAGIPGIRYLDAGSRGKGGTYNTVLFDDSLVKILSRE